MYCWKEIISIILFIHLNLSDGCLHGYTEHGSSCYYYSQDTETWVDAMNVCKIDGGYLAEIDSEDENNYIKSLINGGNIGWVGGADLRVEGEWFWWFSRTTLTSYTNWRQGEPNNVKADENCMYIQDSGEWVDYPCHSFLRYICEMSNEITEIVG